jgi:hypothetical protein
MTAADTLEAKAHELLGQLNPGKLAAIVHLLEVMVEDDAEDSDTLSPAEAKAVAEADEGSKHNKPIPHEEVLSEFGLSVADWEKMSLEAQGGNFPYAHAWPNALSGPSKPSLTFAALSSRSQSRF